MKRWIHAAEELDEEWNVDPFEGHDYYIWGENSTSEPKTLYADTPQSAIEKWFRLGREFPMNVSINCKTRRDAIAVCEAAIGNPDMIRMYAKRFKCPYDVEWLLRECEKQVDRGCKFFHESEWGDMVYPFDIG